MLNIFKKRQPRRIKFDRNMGWVLRYTTISYDHFNGDELPKPGDIIESGPYDYKIKSIVPLHEKYYTIKVERCYEKK